jgi:hypothetical protein
VMAMVMDPCFLIAFVQSCRDHFLNCNCYSMPMQCCSRAYCHCIPHGFLTTNELIIKPLPTFPTPPPPPPRTQTPPPPSQT